MWNLLWQRKSHTVKPFFQDPFYFPCNFSFSLPGNVCCKFEYQITCLVLIFSAAVKHWMIAEANSQWILKKKLWMLSKWWSDNCFMKKWWEVQFHFIRPLDNGKRSRHPRQWLGILCSVGLALMPMLVPQLGINGPSCCATSKPLSLQTALPMTPANRRCFSTKGVLEYGTYFASYRIPGTQKDYRKAVEELIQYFEPQRNKLSKNFVKPSTENAIEGPFTRKKMCWHEQLSSCRNGEKDGQCASCERRKSDNNIGPKKSKCRNCGDRFHTNINLVLHKAKLGITVANSINLRSIASAVKR